MTETKKAEGKLNKQREVIVERCNELQNRIEEHAYQWNKQHKCSCVPETFTPTRENMIICKHLKKDREKRFQDDIDYIYLAAVTNGIKSYKKLINARFGKEAGGGA